MIKTQLVDGEGTGAHAHVHQRDELPSGLFVYTREYYNRVGQTKAAVNPTFGADMNQDVAFSGTPENVHNGIDNTYWTASALSGTWTFNSTAQAFAGTRSIDATATTANDEAQFEDGTSTDLSGFTAFSGAIYIARWDNTGKNVELEVRNAGVLVGNSVSLSNYIDTGVLNSWQTFTIPVADFGTAATINQMVVRTIDTGGGPPPDYYLDALAFQETGSATYTIVPDNSSLFEVTALRFTFVDAYDNRLADSPTPRLAYNQFLALSQLTNGINVTSTVSGKAQFNNTFRSLVDFLTIPGVQIDSGGDGTNTWLTIDVPFVFPLVLNSTRSDKIEVTLSDDLSGLLLFRTISRGAKISLLTQETE